MYVCLLPSLSYTYTLYFSLSLSLSGNNDKLVLTKRNNNRSTTELLDKKDNESRNKNKSLNDGTAVEENKIEAIVLSPTHSIIPSPTRSQSFRKKTEIPLISQKSSEIVLGKIGKMLSSNRIKSGS